MTSSNENIFCVTGLLCGEFAGHRWIPRTNSRRQWRGALIFSLICIWNNSWVNNGDTGDLIRHRAHYDVTVMSNWWPGSPTQNPPPGEKVNGQDVCFSEPVLFSDQTVFNLEDPDCVCFDRSSQHCPCVAAGGDPLGQVRSRFSRRRQDL